MRNKIFLFFLSVLLAATALVLPSSAEDLKGKVIMVKGKDVTIRLNEQGYVIQGDIVEISYDADGTLIPYGTWRVTAVKADGTLEAEPVEVGEQPPTIDLDAIVHATGTKVVSEARKLFAQAREYHQEAEDLFYAKNFGNQKGWKSEENTIDKAIELYRRASEKGHILAGSYLANIYSKGLHRSNPKGRNKEEREKDHALAFKWSLVSAERGSFNAQVEVGRHYVLGLGVPPDAVEAEKWYRKADENAPLPLRAPPSYRSKRYLTEFADSLDINAFRHRTMTKKEVEQKVIALYREAAREGYELAQERLRKKGLKW